MPVKWKIFYALNIILGMPAFICALLIAFNFSAGGRSTMAYWISGVALFILFLMAANSFLNIFLLHRFYPDKLIPTSVRRTARILFISLAIISVGILMLSLVGFIEEFTKSNRDPDDQDDKEMLIIILATMLIQIIILIMQSRLPSLIGRNHQNRIHSLIESIGQPTE